MTLDLVCKARELFDRTVEFYAQAQGACADGLGKQTFAGLKQDAAAVSGVLAEAEATLRKGSELAATCTLPLADRGDLYTQFVELAASHLHPGTCTTELGAARAGADLTRTAIDFHEQWAQTAPAGVEKDLAEKLLGLLRGQAAVLDDLIYFYEDPEGWSRAQRRGGLDGA